ncbi:MAG: PIN domain-containing protein [Saprospiraceae bacterium]
MDIVFLDTSVFVSENFLEGKKIREIYRLAFDNHLRLILPRITYNEILNRIKISTKDALFSYKTFRDKVRVLRNLPEMQERFARIEEEKIASDIQLLFEERMKDIQTIIIEYPTLHIGVIFDKYFGNKFPFSLGDKKNEFPDAFALSSLESWCKESGEKCFVIAADKDILQYESPNLKVINSIDQYLDITLTRIAFQLKRQERLQIALKLFENKKAILEEQINTWLMVELQNERIYYQYSSNDIQLIEIISHSTELMDDPQVTSISEMNIILTSSANILIDVTLQLENDEDFNPELDFPNEVEVLKRIRIPVSFEVEIPLAGDQYMDIKVDEINQGRDLSI